jgi:ectoine hydroxylase-related dioxygenase (phytanoyl-CoA dioxygenase family)
MRNLSDVEIKTFERDGVIPVRNAVDQQWVARMLAVIDQQLDNPGQWANDGNAGASNNRMFTDRYLWQENATINAYIRESGVAALAGQAMGASGARFYFDHLLVKEPGTNKITPWHHDQPYYCVDGRQVCSMWIPLDPVGIETCPEFIAGSHDWGRWFLPRKFSGVDYDHADSALESIPDIDNNRGDYDIRSWSLEPGDAIAFHFLTIHGAPSNLSATHRRRGFAARWLGDDTVYASRSGETSPPFPGLEQHLNPGDALIAEEFPLVFTRPTES